eukprot:357620-Chlamydomonas_euryale.AAC.1
MLQVPHALSKPSVAVSRSGAAAAVLHIRLHCRCHRSQQEAEVRQDAMVRNHVGVHDHKVPALLRVRSSQHALVPCVAGMHACLSSVTCQIDVCVRVMSAPE